MHIRLRLLSDRRFWVVTMFTDSHSHDLSSPDNIHHFYSYQTHRSKMNRTIMTNLVDVRTCPSNIAHVINAMNHIEGYEQVSVQQCIDFIQHKKIILDRSSFLSLNIFKRKQSQIQNFSSPMRLIM